MTRADMDRVRDDFVRAAIAGAECGFDWLELHCAHGYLLSAFICPLTNVRDDDYGGSIENRCRYPLEVFRAVRAVWPKDRPMSVRISAHDWAPGGNTPDDAVTVARLFKDAGADLIDVSSGQTTRDAKPVYGRMYQTPFSDRIRNEVGIATMAVGAIFEPDHVNSILMAGRADLCALARPHLADPYWTLHAAAQLGYDDMPWPPQYLAGRDQLGAISRAPRSWPATCRRRTDERAGRRQDQKRATARDSGSRPQPESGCHSRRGGHADQRGAASRASGRQRPRIARARPASRIAAAVAAAARLHDDDRAHDPDAAAPALRDDAAALRPDGAARAQPRRAPDGRAVAPDDGDRRQRHRHHRPARGRGPGRAAADRDGPARACRAAHGQGPAQVHGDGRPARALDRGDAGRSAGRRARRASTRCSVASRRCRARRHAAAIRRNPGRAST